MCSNYTDTDSSESVSSLISTSELTTSASSDDLNVPDRYGNVALHVAVLQNDIDMLDCLLQEDADLDIQNSEGYTPLNLSIVKQRSESFVMRFIKAGCDINITNTFKTTPLHTAVISGQLNSVALELIKRGANINAQDEDNGTPLHYAVDGDNVKTLCMLLYYGADVNILDKGKRNPFTYALFDNKLKTARILFDYYDDFDIVDEDGYSALHLASLCDSLLAIKMVEVGADINLITDDGCSVLEFSLFHNDAQAFKTIWPKIDYCSLLKCSVPILYNYVKSRNHFQAHEWVECMYLILNSPNAIELVEHCNRYVGRTYGVCNFFQELLYTFYVFGVESNDRITIISIFLTLEAEVCDIYDLDAAIKFYGFNEEFEILMYMVGTFDRLYNYNSTIHPLLPFILALKDFRIETIFNLCKKQIKKIVDKVIPEEKLNYVVTSLGFFSQPYYFKQELLHLFQRCITDCQIIIEKFRVIPEVPTLQELARNTIHKIIRHNNQVKGPYQFHDAVKKLKLPDGIKNIIRFKRPLYE